MGTVILHGHAVRAVKSRGAAFCKNPAFAHRHAIWLLGATAAQFSPGAGGPHLDPVDVPLSFLFTLPPLPQTQPYEEVKPPIHLHPCLLQLGNER